MRARLSRGAAERLVGVGSAHGDDAVGLAVAEQLAGAAPLGVEVRALERPGLDLLEALEGAEAVVLVDALPPAGAPGRILVRGPEALEAQRTPSSHALGPAHALRLGEALGRAPARLRLVGVEAERLEGEGLSGSVRAAVAPAARRALEALEALRAEAEPGEAKIRA